MRFMMMMKACSDYEAGKPPEPKLEAAIGNLIGEMAQRGILLDIGGLLPSSAGARVRAGKSKLTVTDGPFSEAREIIGGYAVLRAASRAEAIALAERFMQLHIDVLGPAYEGECEVRQMSEASDAASGS